MGEQLDIYVTNVTKTATAYDSMVFGLEVIQGILEKVEDGLDALNKAVENVEDFDDFAQKMELALKGISAFSPLKSLAKLGKEAIEAARKNTEEFNEKLAALTEELDSYTSKLNAAQDTAIVFEGLLSNTVADIRSMLPAIETLQSTLNNVGDNAPSSLASLEALVETRFASLNEIYAVASMGGIIDSAEAATQDAIAAIGQLDSFATDILGVADAFNGALGQLSFLETPLNVVSNALNPFAWLLERSASFTDAILDPVLDPILETFGVDELMQDVGDELTAFLDPVRALVPDPTSFAGNLFDILGDNTLPDEIQFLRELIGYFSSMDGIILGEAAYIDPILDDGLSVEQDNTANITFAQDFRFLDWSIPFTSVDFDGMAGTDILSGTGGNDRIFGGADNDLIIASGGDDAISGGDGLGDIWATSGALGDYSFFVEEILLVDVMTLTYIGSDKSLEGTTTLQDIEYLIFNGTTFGFDTLADAIVVDYSVSQTATGNGGDNLLLGGFLADRLFGAGGADQLVGFEESDLLDGDDGIDTVNYGAEGGSGDVTAVLDSTHARYDESNDELVEIENVNGGSGNDTIVGSYLIGNRLNGGSGDDLILGLTGDDTLNGGTGNDVLSGGRGNDNISAGAGRDVIIGGMGGSDTFEDLDLIRQQIDPRFNLVVYSNDHSDFENPFDTATDGDTASELLDIAATWDTTIPSMLPSSIGTSVDFAGNLIVEKQADGVVETDTINGSIGVLGTAANEFYELRAAIDLVDGAGGNDEFRGWQYDDAEPSFYSNSIAFGSDGDDTMISWTVDESFIGGNGDDTYRVLASQDTDFAPETNEGLRERWFIGGQSPAIEYDQAENAWVLGTIDNPEAPVDTGIDTLDLSRSGHDWYINFFPSQYSDPDFVLGDFPDFVSDDAYGFALSYDRTTTTNPPVTQTSFAPIDSTYDLLRIQGVERVLGSDKSEVLQNALGITHFDAGAGDDGFISSSVQSDVYIDLGDGDDGALTGAGVDTLFGGAGNDSIVVRGNLVDADEYTDAGTGNDSVQAYMQYFTVDDGAVVATDGHLFIEGGEGSDYLYLVSGIEYTGNRITVDIDKGTARGSDVDVDFSGFEFFVVLGNDDAHVIGDANDNVLSGGSGEDWILGGGGDDLLFTGRNVTRFGDGGALLRLTGPDTIEGGEGNDRIYMSSKGTAVGGDGNDTLIFGGELNFDGTIIFNKRTNGLFIDLGAGAANAIFGTSTYTFSEFETIQGSMGNDFMLADTSGSNFAGLSGNDTLIGQAGNDIIAGDRGDDILVGKAGDDILTPGAGNDAVNGGQGTDTLDLRIGVQGATLDAITGQATYNFVDAFPLDKDDPTDVSSSLHFQEIEVFNLSQFADNFSGGNADETVNGNNGNDTLQGAGGSDTIFGGGGDDHIIGGGGTAAFDRPDMIWLNQNGARNDYIRSDDDYNMTNINGLTFEFLMQADPVEIGTDSTLISYSEQLEDNDFLFYAHRRGDNDFMRFFIDGRVYDTDLPTSALFDGVLHRVSVVWDYEQAGGTQGAQIYVDGELLWEVEDSAFLHNPGNQGILVFGQEQDSDGRALDESLLQDNQAYVGALGDIRVWEDLRTQEEIRENMFTELGDMSADLDISYYWKVNADTQSIDEQDTEWTLKAVVDDEVLTVETVAGETSGIIWKSGETPVADAGDYLDGEGGNDTLEGGLGDDVLVDGFGDNVMIGGSGNDTLRALSGDNIMMGGTDDDLLVGGIGSDDLDGGSGNDVLMSDVSNLFFGNDVLNGGTGSDLLSGGKGSDTFEFTTGDGDDTIALFDVDYENPDLATATGADFQVGLDHVLLRGFGYTNTSDILANISDVGGHAVFSDQGTTITFFNITAGALSADEFLFA